MNVRYDCGCELMALDRGYHLVPRCLEARRLQLAFNQAYSTARFEETWAAYYAHFPQPSAAEDARGRNE